MNKTRTVREAMVSHLHETYNLVQDGLITEAIYQDYCTIQNLVDFAKINKPWNNGIGRDTENYPLYILEDCAEEALKEA